MSATKSPITRHVRYKRYEKWYATAQNLVDRLADLPRVSVTDGAKPFPSWDDVCDKAERLWRSWQGDGSELGMHIFPLREFSSPESRVLKSGPLIFQDDLEEYDYCWLAPREKHCSKSFWNAKSKQCPTLREVMWMSRSEERWCIMEALKRNFRMDPENAQKVDKGKWKKLEISHLCHNPRCLNPLHLNLEQHGKFYASDPVVKEDIIPGNCTFLASWEFDSANVDITPKAPRQTPGLGRSSAFEGKEVVTPYGSMLVRRSGESDLTPSERNPDVTSGLGPRSGNADRTCKGFPVWIDRKGHAATCPCPHTPKCIPTLTRSFRLEVTNAPLDVEALKKMGMRVGKATSEVTLYATFAPDPPCVPCAEEELEAKGESTPIRPRHVDFGT